MDYWLQRYLQERPSMTVGAVEAVVPCNSSCLEGTEFRSLLSDPSFRSRLEVMDSLVDLIKDLSNTLVREIEEKVQGMEGVNVNALVYTVYRLSEYGGTTSLGEKLRYEGRVLAEGSFPLLINVNKLVDQLVQDQNIRSICDEIRYLTEALWEHFEKNMVRV
jgi:hypothetical protein